MSKGKKLKYELLFDRLFNPRASELQELIIIHSFDPGQDKPQIARASVQLFWPPKQNLVTSLTSQLQRREPEIDGTINNNNNEEKPQLA